MTIRIFERVQCNRCFAIIYPIEKVQNCHCAAVSLWGNGRLYAAADAVIYPENIDDARSLAYEEWASLQISKSNERNRERRRICNAVDDFAAAMKARMLAKAEAGYRGWDDAALEPSIEVMLQDHVSRNVNGSQSVDIANLAMMLWNFDRVRE